MPFWSSFSSLNRTHALMPIIGLSLVLLIFMLLLWILQQSLTPQVLRQFLLGLLLARNPVSWLIFVKQSLPIIHCYPSIGKQFYFKTSHLVSLISRVFDQTRLAVESQIRLANNCRIRILLMTTMSASPLLTIKPASPLLILINPAIPLLIIKPAVPLLFFNPANPLLILNYPVSTTVSVYESKTVPFWSISFSPWIVTRSDATVGNSRTITHTL